MTMCTHFNGVTEVLERRFQDFHCLMVLVKEGDNKMKEIAFPHVVWWLLLKVYHGQVMVRVSSAVQ